MTTNQIFLILACFNLSMSGAMFGTAPNVLWAFVFVMGLTGVGFYGTVEVIRSYKNIHHT